MLRTKDAEMNVLQDESLFMMLMSCEVLKLMLFHVATPSQENKAS